MNFFGGYNGSGYMGGVAPSSGYASVMNKIGMSPQQMDMLAGRPQYNGLLNPTSSSSLNYGAPMGGAESGGLPLGAIAGLLGSLGGGSQGPQIIESNPYRPQAMSIGQLLKMYRGG